MIYFKNWHILSQILVTNAIIHGECSNVEGDLNFDHPQRFRCQSCITVQNPDDRWCLARAILIGLKYREFGKQRYNDDFRSYISNQSLHGKQAERLLRDAVVSTRKQFYNIEDAKKIQELITRRYGPQQIRLVIFSVAKNNGIVWKGWDGAPAVYNLCLYHNNNHFSFISEPKALLKVSLRKLVYTMNAYTILGKRFLHRLRKSCGKTEVSCKRMCCSMLSMSKIWSWIPLYNVSGKNEDRLSRMSFYLS